MKYDTEKKTRNYLIRTTVRQLSLAGNPITWGKAKKRVNALLESGMLTDINFNPDNELHQIAIALFLEVPTDQFKNYTKESFDLVKNAVLSVIEEKGNKII